MRTRFQDLGEPLIIAALLALLAACAAYCVPRTAPYSREEVPAPTSAYDYVLYLACGLFGILLAYVESRHHWLGANWDFYLLGAAAAAFFLAYRCDNRLVLAVGLANLATWWAKRCGALLAVDWAFPILFFGGVAGAAGLTASRWRIKPHFADTYYTVAFHCGAAAMIPQAIMNNFLAPQFYVLLAFCAAAIYYALEKRRFAFFLYGAGYAYVAVSATLFRFVMILGVASVSLYSLVSTVGMVWLCIYMRGVLKETD